MPAMHPLIAEPGAKRTTLLAVAVTGAALASIVGGVLAPAGEAWQWLHWIAKPLATLLILAAAARGWTPVTMRYRRWIVGGIGFSLIGDVLLMWPADLFVPGLVAFLCGHVCFITALLGDSRLAIHPLGFFGCLLVGGVNLWLLWPSIPAALRLAVAVYGLVLSSMGGQAIARAWQHASIGSALARPARRAALGAALFMVSDSLLAWSRFHGALPLSTWWVLGSYYAALWFIARSVARDDNAIRSDGLT